MMAFPLFKIASAVGGTRAVVLLG
jgi:hypothetical protein